MHQKLYGADYPYANFAPQFRAELFDPAHWADVFERSGAKYVALTSKHHEGFRALAQRGGFQNVGPAVERRGSRGRTAICWATSAARCAPKDLKMGIYYSLYEWYNPLYLTTSRVTWPST
jgi:alpha-L-fucosidase